MEEKNLVTLPSEAVAYLEYMKRNNYTLIGALKLAGHNSEMNKYMDDYLNISSNQEKFALAWINGYKVEEQKFLVKFKNLGDVYGYLNYEVEGKNFKKWIGESYESDKRIITLVNMHQFGYEVGKGHRYIVKFKGVSGDARYLNHETDGNWYINSRQETHQFRVAHTRKELEEADFGWVFDCKGVEVKEVK